jgi:hypothetical protein
MFAALAVMPGLAQPRFFLGVEVGQGLFVADHPPHPFTASLRVHPMWRFGSARTAGVGLTSSATYVNPGMSWMGGGRISYELFRLTAGELRLASLHLAGEALWGTDDRNPVGGALIIEAGGVVQLTLRGARDLARDVSLFEISLGVDLWRWLAPREDIDPFDF